MMFSSVWTSEINASRIPIFLGIFVMVEQVTRMNLCFGIKVRSTFENNWKFCTEPSESMTIEV
jgi:hypothetical protein